MKNDYHTNVKLALESMITIIGLYKGELPKKVESIAAIARAQLRNLDHLEAKKQ